MSTLIAAFATAFIIAFLFIPVIIRIFEKKKILDTPGRRKIHKHQKPSMGGIAIFASFMVATSFWVPFEGLVHFKYLFIALFITFITGMRDDLIPLKPLVKLISQLIAAIIAVYLVEIKLESFYGLFSEKDFPLFISYFISVFTIIVITNSFNLIDGLDGLAGTVSIIALLAFGIWFWIADYFYVSILSFALAGGVAAFLNFNWEPSKIFMGDTGALFIGFFLSVLAIMFIHINYHLPTVHPFKFHSSVSTAVCVLIIPLWDTSRIFALRILQKKSPFTPDKNHIHHILMRLGLNHSGVVIILGLVNLFFIGIALLLRNYNDSIVLVIVLAVLILAGIALEIVLKRRIPKNIRKRNRKRDEDF